MMINKQVLAINLTKNATFKQNRRKALAKRRNK